jgi:hypothetical protein
VRRAFKIYNWLGGDIYNLFSDALASSIYAIPRHLHASHLPAQRRRGVPLARVRIVYVRLGLAQREN